MSMNHGVKAIGYSISKETHVLTFFLNRRVYLSINIINTYGKKINAK